MSKRRPFWASWKPFALAWPLALVLMPATVLLRDTDRDAVVRYAPLVLAFPNAVVLAAAQRHADGWLPWGWVMLFQWPVYALVVWTAARRGRTKAAAIAVAVLHLAAVVAGAPWSWGPSLGDFARHLRQTAGPAARDCGIVAYEAPYQNAVACARGALADGTAFSVGFQVMGIDSAIYLGLARPAGGSTVEVHWDSDMSGGSNLVPLSNLYDLPCPRPSIQDEDGSPGIECDAR